MERVELHKRPSDLAVAACQFLRMSCVLVECATHAILGANLGPYRAAEWDICKPLLARLVQRRRTLHSKTPNGVRQEFYGWVLAHYAVCWLMHQTQPSPDDRR